MCIRDSNDSEQIIVATDAGREGELIFRYLYHYIDVYKRQGHKSIKTTQIYAKITKEKLNQDMENLAARLNQICLLYTSRCV